MNLKLISKIGSLYWNLTNSPIVTKFLVFAGLVIFLFFAAYYLVQRAGEAVGSGINYMLGREEQKSDYGPDYFMRVPENPWTSNMPQDPRGRSAPQQMGGQAPMGGQQQPMNGHQGQDQQQQPMGQGQDMQQQPMEQQIQQPMEQQMQQPQEQYEQQVAPNPYEQNGPEAVNDDVISDTESQLKDIMDELQGYTNLYK